jgi:hypothetical protein
VQISQTLRNAWREAPLYTDRARAARHGPKEAETVNLTMLIVTINAWNRLAIMPDGINISPHGSELRNVMERA